MARATLSGHWPCQRTAGKWLDDYKAEGPHSTHGLIDPGEAFDSEPVAMSIAAQTKP